ncbi:MAG: cbb3-type cytochrome c oxidase subunit 3 [Hyphomicrobiaceae bacterium]
MSYQSVAAITQSASLLIFFAVFIGVVAYVYWPGNKEKFEEAAMLPLKKDSDTPDLGRRP